MSVTDANATEIPLAEEAPRDVLEKIVQFLQHHDGNPMKEIVKPIQSSIMADLVSDWDSEFINVDSEFLYKLLKVCWNQSCHVVANFVAVRRRTTWTSSLS